MRGSTRRAVALAAVAALPLSAAIASPAQPRPGALFVGAPAHFGSDLMHLRVNRSGKSMALVGEFAWSYGCRVIANYGIADASTRQRLRQTPFPLFAPPKIQIHGTSFSGSAELARGARRYGHFTIHGQFTGAHSARASFSFADPPHCGTFTEHFTLHAA